MKTTKKRCTIFKSRIVSIALVTMLAATNLWAKPKNKVEYSPFKSENPNATVFECEYIPGYSDGLHLYCNFRTRYENKVIECSSIVVYGWQKKKGGWEKLWEYRPEQSELEIKAKILDDDSDKYTHYAVEAEIPENSMTFSTKGETIYNVFNDYCIMINIYISESYQKLLDENRAAERKAEEEAIEKARAEAKAKANAEKDAKAKEIAKGYIYHGIDEADRNAKLFSGGALEEGHAYYISRYIAGKGGTTGAAYISSVPNYQLVEYASQKVKADVVTASTGYEYSYWLQMYVAETVPVVVAGGRNRAIILGVIQ